MSGVSDEVFIARKAAAMEALKFLVNVNSVGVGTGSTTALVIELAHKHGLLKGKALVPTSMETAQILSDLGYLVVDSSTVDFLDVYIDSADEVDLSGRMIKGGGAAHLMEKLLARHSKLRVFVVDEFKVVEKLGSKHLIPVEVVPKALKMVLNDMRRLGFNAVLRTSSGKRGPTVSDTLGVIVDVKPPEGMALEEIYKALKSLTGVVEVGLFLDEADVIIVGTSRGEVRRIVRNSERIRGLEGW